MSEQEPQKRGMARWVLVGIFVMGFASIVGIVALIMKAIEKVRSGEGLDSYRTAWLVEFNYVGVLVLFGAVLLALLIGGFMRYREYREWRKLEEKYGDKRENA